MPTFFDYTVGMKRNHDKTIQLTVRNVPAQVKSILVKKAEQEGKSLNTVLVEVLSSVAGQDETYTDLDFLAGLWIEDPDFDRAIQDQKKIDPDIWK